MRLSKIKYILLVLSVSLSTTFAGVETEYDRAYIAARSARPHLTLVEYVGELAREAAVSTLRRVDTSAAHAERMRLCQAVLYFMATGGVWGFDERSRASCYEAGILKGALTTTTALVHRYPPISGDLDLFALRGRRGVGTPTSPAVMMHLVVAQAVIVTTVTLSRYPDLPVAESMRDHCITRGTRDIATQLVYEDFCQRFQHPLSTFTSNNYHLVIFYISLLDLDTLNSITTGIKLADSTSSISRLDDTARIVFLGRVYQILTSGPLARAAAVGSMDAVDTSLVAAGIGGGAVAVRAALDQSGQDAVGVRLLNGWTVVEAPTYGTLPRKLEVDIGNGSRWTGESFLEDGFFLKALWSPEELAVLLHCVAGIYQVFLSGGQQLTLSEIGGGQGLLSTGGVAGRSQRQGLLTSEGAAAGRLLLGWGSS